MHSLSPRYLSPIVSHSGGPFEEEFVMGCSVCGTRAIEEAAWTYHKSPPRIRPSNRPELTSVDEKNSGAYAKILSWKAQNCKTGPLSESISTHEVKLLEGKLPAQSSPFPSTFQTSSGSLVQTTLVKEVFPTPSVPLTPLNYLESGLIKDSVFHNSLAERYVKDEERMRVSVRRAEYANRVKGFTRVVEAVKVRGEFEEDKGVEAALQAGEDPLYSEEDYKEESRPGARMKPGDMAGKRGRGSDRSHGVSEEGSRADNVELARRKLEAIKQTVRQRREERKSKEASLSPAKPTKPLPLLSTEDLGEQGEESEEEETPPHPVMTPAVLRPSFDEGESLQPYETTATTEKIPHVSQSLEVPCLPTRFEPQPTVPPSLPSPRQESEPLADISERSGRFAVESRRSDDVLGSGDFRHEDNPSRTPKQLSESTKPPNLSEVSAGGTTLGKGTIGKQEEDSFSRPTKSFSSFDPAFPNPQDRRSDQRFTPEQDAQHTENEGDHRHSLAEADDHSRRLLFGVGAETSESKFREMPSEAITSLIIDQPAGLPFRKSDQTPMETHTHSNFPGTRTNQQPRPPYSPLSLPIHIARTSGEDTTERLEGERFAGTKAGLSSSRLTAEVTTERHRSREGDLRAGESYSLETTGEKHVRVLPKQQERRKVATAKVAAAQVSQVASFHRLQWESVVRIQRAYRRYVIRARNNKACQTECLDYARLQVNTTQELLTLLGDPSILSGLRLLGGFVTYLQSHGLHSL